MSTENVRPPTKDIEDISQSKFVAFLSKIINTTQDIDFEKELKCS